MFLLRPAGVRLNTSALARIRPNRRFASSTPPVIGSAPQYPRHLVIHTPHPTSTWPSHLESVSHLYRELGQRWAKHPELSKLGFGMSDGGTGPVEEQWDSRKSKFDEPAELGEDKEERYSATLYPDFLQIPDLSPSSIASFESLYRSLPSPQPIQPSSGTISAPPRTHIFVCTHTTRDCRCGDLGEPLYQALLKEIQRRKLGGELRDGEDGVRIARVAHIGGHKWAGNALVYKEGGACDWYGLLRADDAPKLLDYATSPSSLPWFSRWRGRLALISEETKAVYASQPSAVVEDKSDQPRQELGDRVEIVFITYEGEEKQVLGYEGESLMETARRNDMPSILATCGGHCECATCHVHIPPISPGSTPSAIGDPSAGRQPLALPQLAPLPEMTDEEDEQLEFAIGADDDSRLACQIPVTKELAGWIKAGGRIKLPRY
ncbi:ferredoxin [Rhodotorula toruloides]|uniref:Ferredoxin n=1 Tax=Rhodotorula toruloides TaxID=5286 RepID=A0A511KBZ1_RHOTO|nr:ferredoxin [Rhodotorula toruloides]